MQRQTLLTWTHRYNVGVTATYALAALAGPVFFARADDLAISMNAEVKVVYVFAMMWTLTMAFLSFVHAAAARLPVAPWAWAVQGILFGLGLTTLVLWPFALPLLLFWLKKDTQAHFGRIQPAS